VISLRLSEAKEIESVEIARGSSWIGWLPISLLPLMAVACRNLLPPWVFMCHLQPGFREENEENAEVNGSRKPSLGLVTRALASFGRARLSEIRFGNRRLHSKSSRMKMCWICTANLRLERFQRILRKLVSGVEIPVAIDFSFVAGKSLYDESVD
jgi:hypothetical protein